jgi:tripartite-type tricarboxylate transporter receptor subunit TctC
VQWVVPFPAGGANDVFARALAKPISQRIGQPVVIDNRGGAGGTVGAAAVAHAEADGYTLLMAYTGHTYAPQVYPQAGFELLRDFAPVSALARLPVALAVNPAVLDVNSLEAFVARARKAPSQINIGSNGLGTVPHLAIELLEARAKIQLSHVPYRGGAPALQDLLGGQIDAVVLPFNLVVPYVQAGKLLALAVAGRRRSPMLPDVPTFIEYRYEDFVVSTWYGMFAPIHTPRQIVDRLHGVVQASLAEPEVKRLWEEQGARVELETRRDFARFVALEVERWNRIAHRVVIEMD